MALFSDEGLVLETHPYRDRDLVVVLLARGHGALRAVFRGARAGKAPKSAETQVLTHVRFSAYLGPHAEMATLREVEAVQSSFPLAASLERAAAAAVVAELLASFFPTAEPAHTPFRLGRSILAFLLDDGEARRAVVYAQFWALMLCGVLPPLDRCTGCGSSLHGATHIAVTGGQPRCDHCSVPGAETLDELALRFLGLCRVTPIEQLAVEPPAAAANWLDVLTRQEAGRSLPALDFFKKHALPETIP